MPPEFHPELKPWGIYDSEGRLVFLDLCETEEDAWRLALGWPDQEEIDAAKAGGLSASPVVAVRA